jgi:hypothetical protein
MSCRSSKSGNQVKNDALNAGNFKWPPLSSMWKSDEDLNVINVFTSGAEVVVDGVRQTPVSRVFTSKKDPEILIVTHASKLVSATKKDKTTGKSTEVNLIQRSSNYATVTSGRFGR